MGRFRIISLYIINIEIRDTYFERDIINVTRYRGLVVNNIDDLIIIPLRLYPSDLFKVSVIIEYSLKLLIEVIRSYLFNYIIIYYDFT